MVSLATSKQAIRPLEDNVPLHALLFGGSRAVLSKLINK